MWAKKIFSISVWKFEEEKMFDLFKVVKELRADFCYQSRLVDDSKVIEVFF